MYGSTNGERSHDIIIFDATGRLRFRHPHPSTIGSYI